MLGAAAAARTAALLVTCSMLASWWRGGEALRLAPHEAGVLVETLRELATRGKRTSTSGTGFGKGAKARVAVRSVLEDHETAILELERQVCEVECFGEPCEDPFW